ncbi:Peptide chain release factor 1 [Urinicoccus massiliensis]|uniref:Peptide chain release factor 1 n=1 Tax=Urinicoccus massiliensis TaxID=1723382 RepID=A0A8H2R160_9FIRM|nr:peptide chain release factor 1 [Urinicoccus massiliensis]KGF10936.1 peptide chain release factor 1 [Tissierellia bacterium S5-A11]VFB16348.1 Peptide chain release factor 1 [Urinicoccus massiliensis]
MYDKLSVFEDRLKELEGLMIDPAVISDSQSFQKYAIEHGELLPVVEKYRQYRKLSEDLASAKSLFNEPLDEEMKELVKEEITQNEEDLARVENELKILLVPKDKNDDKNVIIEIRAGAGGDEAALFAGVLFRQYLRYAEKHNWQTDVLNTNEIGIGGYKEVIFMVQGKGAYSRLKYESGVHRVQRVPETESSGRIHTSTATVVVLPEVEDIEVEIDETEIRVDYFRSSGHGGQSVNTTDSAVRLTHIPTGIVVSCQDEKSQIKNKAKAMTILKSRIYDQMQAEQNKEISAEKKSQIGSGDRSERIRTYNYPQGRVTDHRINFTSHQIDAINDGDLDELIDALTAYDQAEKVKNI